jgi:hypothetical protein
MAGIPADREILEPSDNGPPGVKIDHDTSDLRFGKLCILCNLKRGKKRHSGGLRVAKSPLDLRSAIAGADDLRTVHALAR